MINRLENIKTSIAYLLKEKSKNFSKMICLCFIYVTFSFSFVFNILDIKSVEASTIENDKLIERISKDYTKKFCNSLAFGLSRESAMNFSNKENNMIFKKKKGFDSLDKDEIANKIAISVVEDCGYLANLRGQDGINKFEDDYLFINNSISKEN